MALVIILIILGIFLLGVEVFLLPGITVAGIGALISCGFGIYEAFVKYGNAGDSLRWRPYSYCRSSCWQWGCEQRHGSGLPCTTT